MKATILRGIPLILTVTGVLVIIGWVMNLSFILTFGSDTSMKFITAILFVICGFQLCLMKGLLLEREISSRRHAVFFRCTIVLSALLIGASILAMFSASFAYFIHAVPSSAPSDLWRAIPEVPSYMTMLCFLLITGVCALVAPFLSSRRLNRLMSVLGVFLLVVSLIAIVGHITGFSAIYYGSRFSPGMAPHTAGLFFLIGVFLLLSIGN